MRTALRKIAFLGNHPPRHCGIATFTQDLVEAVAGAAPKAQCVVGAVNDRAEGYDYPQCVRFEIQEQELDSYRRAADFLNFNNADVLCIQHEFGIYGGSAGSHLIALLKEIRMPVVTTLHTVLQDPDPAQRKVMKEIVNRSDRLVVMAQKGAEILRERYDVPGSMIDVIPHGIPDVDFSDSSHYKAQFGLEGRQVLFTFGLIGPGKGIEHAIRALPRIVEKHPNVTYLILGATHPNLLAREGERYRMSLERLAGDCGVRENVIFHNRYVTMEELKEFIGLSDIYLTPYLNENQITSGTLAYVFGAGKPVVSTPYWHASELLDNERGVLVPFADSNAIADAVCGLLDDPSRIAKIRSEAYAMGRKMVWPEIGKRYLNAFKSARAYRWVTPRTAFSESTLHIRPRVLPPSRLDHVARMSDGTGIFQHATFSVPNFHEGYCTDDNARAFILCKLLDEPGIRPPAATLDKLSTSYLAFLAAAMDYERGRFRNFMNHGRQWLEIEGSEDSHARALWATGTGAGRSRDISHRRLSAQLFEKGIPAMDSFTSPRAWAFSLLGIHEYLSTNRDEPQVHGMRERLTARLLALRDGVATPDWPWFENSITYENARMCQALILSGQSMPDSEALKAGLQSLGWLASIQTNGDGLFRPIGSNGFYQKDGARADFDQQPVETQAMVAACQEAFRATGDPKWAMEARRAFEWFLGANDLGIPLYDFTTGGCSDGLHCDRISENQGAESTLAFQLALAEMNHADHQIANPTHPAELVS